MSSHSSSVLLQCVVCHVCAFMTESDSIGQERGARNAGPFPILWSWFSSTDIHQKARSAGEDAHLETRDKGDPPHRPRRSFTPEFKAEIIERCLVGDRSIAQAARDFGGASAAGDLPLDRLQADARTMSYRDELSAVRQFIAVQARQARLRSGRVTDLVIAANALAANTLALTAGPGTPSAWSTRSEIICQVSDTGPITGPLAGTRPRGPAVPGGHVDLWVVQQICDLVQIQTGPQETPSACTCCWN